jgi:hypothetical protein
MQRSIYMQRVAKCLHDAYQVFFIPECLPMYYGLELISGVDQFKKSYLETYD